MATGSGSGSGSGDGDGGSGSGSGTGKFVAKPKCGSCYGAGDEGQCCESCEVIRELYRKKGWAFRPSGMEQVRCVVLGVGRFPADVPLMCRCLLHCVLPLALLLMLGVLAGPVRPRGALQTAACRNVSPLPRT